MRALLVATFGLFVLGAAAPAATLQELPIPAQAQPPAPPGVEPPADVGAPAANPVDAPLDGLWPTLGPGGAWDPGAVIPPEALPAVAATAGVGALALFAGFALYSRLARSDILDHERRDAVYKLVQEEPGISLSDVAQRTGLGWGTAVYHLDRLERNQFVLSEKKGGKRCYFPVGTVPKEARAPLATLREDALRVVATCVQEKPGMTQGELAAALGLSASAASKQVTKLESAGLVRREREWKTVRLHPEPKLAELLAPAGMVHVSGPAVATA